MFRGTSDTNSGATAYSRVDHRFSDHQHQTNAPGQAAINAKVMPGITLVGSSPTFCHIPVTKELVQAVTLGYFPAKSTVVYAHLPVVPRPARRLCEGMKPLVTRHLGNF